MKVCLQCAVQYPDSLEFCPRDGSKLPPAGPRSDDPLIGQTIDGRYVVETLLGEGGMGQVYAARHAIIDKRVALKVLRKEAAADDSAAQRFIIEAKAASKIGHQNIVDITDFGLLPAGNAYFVMEQFNGPTLGKILHQQKTLPPLRTIAIAIQTARGLSAAHEQSIIHRDLKPENLFVLDRDGHSDFVKIVDFGIAKDVKAGKRLTAAGMVLGTPEYMSPEQATGQPSDHRVDQYSLGCILYEMLTGDVPFKGENAPKTLTKHVFDPLVPPSQLRPDLPAVLEAVVVRMLSKRPEERFADMRAVVAALEAAESELRAQPRTETTELDRLPRSRTPLLVAAAAAAGLVALGLVALGLRHSAPATPTASSASATPAGAAGSATAAGATANVPAGATGNVPAGATGNVPAGATAVPAGATTGSASAAGLPAAATEVELQVTTDPPGAEVLLGGERLGLAPIDVKRARGATPTRFTVRRLGYKEVTRSLTLDRDQSLAFVLQPRRERPAAAVKARPPGSTPSTARPAGHKTSDELRDPFK